MSWDNLPAHLIARIRSDSVTAPKDLPEPPPELKYGNEITEVNGIKFDSAKEAMYYADLLWLLKAGHITKIELQPRFILQPGYDHKGKHVRPITYVADFKVTEANGHVYYVDTKGMKTQVYRIKKKMLLYTHPDIDFREE